MVYTFFSTDYGIFVLQKFTQSMKMPSPYEKKYVRLIIITFFNSIDNNKQATDEFLLKIIECNNILPVSNFSNFTTKGIHFMYKLRLCRPTYCWIARLYQNFPSEKFFQSSRLDNKTKCHFSIPIVYAHTKTYLIYTVRETVRERIEHPSVGI